METATVTTTNRRRQSPPPEPAMTPEQRTAARERVAASREQQERERAEAVARVRALIAEGDRSDAAKRAQGTMDAADDLGPDGSAAAARTSRIETIGGRSGGSGHAAPIATTVRRYEVECRLDYLMTKGTVTSQQRHAGMTFRSAWLKVHKPPQVTAGYGERVGGRMADGRISVQEIEYRQECRQRLDRAHEELTAQEWMVVVSVCGEDEALERVGGTRVWNRKVHLLSGLSKLADLWCRPIGELRV